MEIAQVQTNYSNPYNYKTLFSMLITVIKKYDKNYKLTFFHLKLLQEILKYLVSDKHGLAISIPPRHGKTYSLRMLVCALLMYSKFPIKIIYVGATKMLGAEFVKQCRYILGDASLFVEDTNRQDFIRLKSNMAYLYGCGIENQILGLGANLIIIDDVYKNYQQYLSERYNRNLQNFFDTVLVTRLENPLRKIIAINTRFGLEDFIDFLVKEKKFDHVSYPLLDENENVLCEDIMPKAEALRIKESMPDFIFSAQYLQNPIPKSNYLSYEDLNIVDYDYFKDQFDYTFAIVDTSLKGNEENDFFAYITYGVRANNFFVLEVFQKKMNASEQEKQILALKKMVNWIFIEDAGVGTYFLQKYQDFKALSPKGRPKLLRFLQALETIKNKVYIHSKFDLLLSMLISFPYLQNDDLIDCVSYLNDIKDLTLFTGDQVLYVGKNIKSYIRKV